MVKCGPGRAGVLALVLALAWTAGAGAHPETSPELVNRYYTVMLGGDRLQVFVVLLVGALPAIDERRAMDRDGDGRVTIPERAAASAAWRRRAGDLFTLAVDRRTLAPDAVHAEVQVGAEDTVTAAPLVIEVAGSVRLAQDAHEIRLDIDMGWEPPRLGETEIGIELAPDWLLEASRQGGAPPAKETRFKILGPRRAGDDRSVTLSVRPTAGTAPAPARGSGRVALAVTALLLAAGASAVALRRRARRAGGRYRSGKG